jgi:cycloeucalenol cycloisomerase
VSPRGTRSASPRRKEAESASRSWGTWPEGLLAKNASKRAAERFNLAFSAVWIAVFGSVVVTQAYLSFGDWAYMALGLFVALPYFVVPLLFPFEADARVPFHQRYFVVSNVWIAVLSFVGNYLWTHYFYTVLGASYSFPVQLQLNRVPFFLYLVTHGYFVFYHTCTTIVLRAVYASSDSRVASAAAVFGLAVFTAFMETWTISSVPFYSHPSLWRMYTVGSVFYGIYFYVSFPMFVRVGEERPWTAREALIDSLAACMAVTLLLDLWRLVLGGAGSGPPWIA